MLLSKKISVLIGFFCLCTISIFSQSTKTTFSGTILDESNQPIPGATLMILHAVDSVLAQFGSTDPQGAFTLKNVPKGDYLLNITFLGLEPVYQPITSGASEAVNLGNILMTTQSKVLSEVEVKADIIPIEVKKDTITYNTDAFHTQPNANVEDLLKKLPGIEVGADGTIKAQGEDVQKVYVDGKEFFGTDPKMATKNLPARAIKKIKVYDKQSDMAEFTGVDDGTREKTIDLQLKEEFKKGLFGKAQAGYGSDGRYNAAATINKFNKTSQLSFLGQLNNINEQGFSFSDMMSFSGGMRNMGGGGGNRTTEFRMSGDLPINNGTSTGQVNTGAAGINWNWHKTKNFNFRSSYFFNGVNKSVVEDVFRQNLSDMPFNTDENSDESTDNKSHRLTLNSDIKFDSTQEISLTGRASFGNATGLSESFLQNYLQGGAVQSESQTTEDNTNDNISLSASTTYMKRLGQNGRNASVNLSYSDSDQDNETSLQALTELFTTGSTEALDQLQFSYSDNTQWETQLSYTEPLKKKRFLEFNYLYSQSKSRYDRDVLDIINETAVENPSLSNQYQSIFSYHRPGATFRYSGQIHNLNIGLQYQISDLTGQLDQEVNEINNKYNHFIPRIIWRYDVGNGKNLRVSYTTRVYAPSITQLSPVIDNSDPLRLYIGNPNLNAEYNHQVGANFHSFTQFSSTSFFASLNGSITENKIITSRNTDEQFREVSTPINIDSEKRLSVNTSFGRPFKPLHSRVNLNGNLSFTKTQNVINTDLLDVNRWSRSAGISFSNLNSEVLEYNLGTTWTFTDNYYKADDGLNQNTLLQTYFIDATLTVWKKWRLQGSYNYNLYSSAAFGSDQALPLMKLSLSRYVLPGDKGQIVFSIFDALDENRGLSRSADINYIEEIRSNSIGRYAMLSFIYSINGKNQEPPGAMRIIERR